MARRDAPNFLQDSKTLAIHNISDRRNGLDPLTGKAAYCLTDKTERDENSVALGGNPLCIELETLCFERDKFSRAPCVGNGSAHRHHQKSDRCGGGYA